MLLPAEHSATFWLGPAVATQILRVSPRPRSVACLAGELDQPARNLPPVPVVSSAPDWTVGVPVIIVIPIHPGETHRDLLCNASLLRGKSLTCPSVGFGSRHIGCNPHPRGQLQSRGSAGGPMY